MPSHSLCLVILVLLVLSLLLFLHVAWAVVSKHHPVRMNLLDKHVLITGSSSGIGLEIAKICARAGSNVTLIARNLQNLTKAQALVINQIPDERRNFQRVVIVSADISTNYKQIRDALVSAVKENGRIDFLVSSSGYAKPCNHSKLDAGDYANMMNVNLLGPALLCKAAFSNPNNMSSPGRVVLISSQAGQIGVYGYSGYSAAKAGLTTLAQSLQMETITQRIHFTVAFPPDTDTPGYRAEQEIIPLATRLISGSSGLWSAQDVAQTVMQHACIGQFCCWFGLSGYLAVLVSSGSCPTYNPLHLIVDCMLAGVARFIAAFVIFRFYTISADTDNKAKIS